MRIEAHLSDTPRKLEVRVLGISSKPHFDSIRKNVRGSRYLGRLNDPNGYRCSYPLSVDTCQEMREKWGDNLKVAKSLAAWYREALAKRSAQVSITKQTDAHLPVLAKRYPAFNAWLKGDQRVTAAWVKGAYRNAGLLADEVGTGKTAGVIAGIIEAEVTGPVLVVCPKISVGPVWGKEFAKHVPDVPVYLARGKRKTREQAIADFAADPSVTKVLVIVAEMLRAKGEHVENRFKLQGYEYPALQDVSWSAVVVDESQKLFGAMDVVKGTLASEGIRRLSYSTNPLRLAVSATPFGKGGRVSAMFGTLHWLWPDEYSSRWAWLERHFEVTEERVPVRGGGGMTKPVRKVGGLKHEEKFWTSLGPRVLRRTMEEVSPAHKGLKNFVEVLCEMEPAQRKQYETFTENAELPVQGGILSTVGVLDYLTRARQLANGVLRMEGGRVAYTGVSAKLDRLESLLEELQGRKVVIASQYNEFLDAAENRLDRVGYWSEYRGQSSTHPNGKYVRLDGKTSETKRNEIMEAFQGGAPEVRVGITCRFCQAGKGKPHGERCRYRLGPSLFLLNAQAGGVSITLDAADAMIVLDEPDSVTGTQLYGRIFRRGRAHEVTYYILRTMGTIDEQVGENVEAKHTEQLKVLDGRRGLEYARTIAKYRGEEK